MSHYNVIVSSTPLPGKIEDFQKTPGFPFVLVVSLHLLVLCFHKALLKDRVSLNIFLRDEKTGDECFQFLVYYMNAKY